MLQNKTILVAGGDLRQVTIAQMLGKNNKVFCVGLDQSSGISEMKTSIDDLVILGIKIDYIIFPMPASIDNNTVNTPFSNKAILLDDVLSLAHPHTFVYGGKLSPVLKQRLVDKKLWFIDYLDREELAVLNAVPTAEGAIQIAMEELATTIYGTNCLIVGYGRISKVLLSRLIAFGANVTVSARNYKDLAWIQINGGNAVHTRDLKTAIVKKQIVFNTVPATVLNEDTLAAADDNCLIIDLASKPGGIDFATAKKLGLKTIWALSLPGKVAPITAGEIIFNTIQNIESERRSSHETD